MSCTFFRGFILLTSLLVITGCTGVFDSFRDMTTPQVDGGVELSVQLKTLSDVSISGFPIEFEVDFSQEIDPNSFSSSLIQQSGTAQGVEWEVSSSGNNKKYIVRALRSLTQGTVIPVIDYSSIRLSNGKGPVKVETMEPPKEVLFSLYSANKTVSPETVGYKTYNLAGVYKGQMLVYSGTDIYFYNMNNGQLTLQNQLAVGQNFSFIKAIDDFIFVSDPNEDTNQTDSGIVYIYSYNGTSLSLEGSFKPASLAAKEYFGTKIFIENNTMAIYSKHFDGVGDYLGKIFLYEFNGTNWIEKQSITGETSNYSHYLGSKVQFVGQEMFVADDVWTDDGLLMQDKGRLQVYKNVNGTWIFQENIFAPEYRNGLYFARDFVVIGDFLAVDSIYRGAEDPLGGIHIYKRENGIWKFKYRLPYSGSLFFHDSVLYVGTGLSIVALKSYGDIFLVECEFGNKIMENQSYKYFGKGKIEFYGDNFYVDSSRYKDSNLYSGAIFSFKSVVEHYITNVRLEKDIFVKRGDTALVPVKLNKPAAVDIHLKWKTIDSTAVQGTHFVERSGEITIAKGSDSGLISITTLSNESIEEAKNFFVEIESVTGADFSEGNITSVYLYKKFGVELSKSDLVDGSNALRSGNQLFIGYSNSYQFGVAAGAIEYYELLNGQWSLKQILNASDAGTSRGFGRVVQKYGDYLATSANSTSAWNAPGKVYVFHFNGTSWVEEDSFLSDTPFSSDNFGLSIAMDESVLLIGSSYNGSGSAPGAVSIFQRSGNTWSQIQRIETGGASGYASYGRFIDWDHNTNRVAITMSGLNKILFYTISGATLTLVNEVLFDTTYPAIPGSFKMDGDFAIMGQYSASVDSVNDGLVQFFKFNGVSWEFDGYVKQPTNGGVFYFGKTVEINGTRAYVGNSTYLMVFDRIGSSWVYMGYWGGQSNTNINNIEPLSLNFDDLSNTLTILGAFSCTAACMVSF